MAQVGPPLSGSEREALQRFLFRLLEASRAGRQTIRPDTPTERWLPYEPAVEADKLTSRTRQLLIRYGWNRRGGTPAAEAIGRELFDLYAGTEIAATKARFEGLLFTACYWLDPSAQTSFSDDSAIIAIEQFSALVNGFVLALPRQLSFQHNPDLLNRRFKAFQRRILGITSTPRTPQGLVRRLPMAAGELVNAYMDKLVYESIESATTFAATAAIAAGRPGDRTFVWQLELTFAIASVWAEMEELPKSIDSENSHDHFVHPLLGARPDSDNAAWDSAAGVFSRTMTRLRKSDLDASDPRAVLPSAHRPINGVMLDGVALDAFSKLDDYVNDFANWVRDTPLGRMPIENRLTAFDRALVGHRSGRTARGIVATLPALTVEVINRFSPETDSPYGGDQTAEHLAEMLGDRSLTPRLLRTLEAAHAWSNGRISHLERTASKSQEIIDLHSHDADLAFWSAAKVEDALSVLQFGSAVVSVILHAGSTEDTGGQNWWLRFHKNVLDQPVRGPLQLLRQLSPGGRQLVMHYAEWLDDDAIDDLTEIPYALSTTVEKSYHGPRDSVAGRFAIGLAAASIWQQLDEISRGGRSPNVLGALPTTEEQRLIASRAHALLEWGLQTVSAMEHVRSSAVGQ